MLFAKHAWRVRPRDEPRRRRRRRNSAGQRCRAVWSEATWKDASNLPIRLRLVSVQYMYEKPSSMAARDSVAGGRRCAGGDGIQAARPGKAKGRSGGAVYL